MSSEPSPASREATAEIRTALKKRDFSRARELAEKLAEDHPDDAESFYLLAVSQRYLGESAAALDTLDKLLQLDSQHARAFQERGHNFARLGKTNSAVDTFRRAAELNPALHASWKGLALGLRALGKNDEAEQALGQFQHLHKLPPELLGAASLMYEKKLLKAEQLCRNFLQCHRHHPEAMRLLALIGAELGILDDADFLLESCLALYPDFHQARFDYIGVLRKRQKFAAALAQAKILRERQGNRQADILFATQSAMVGDYETALRIYDHIAAGAPQLHGIHLQRGHTLKTIGDAEGHPRLPRCLRSQAGFWRCLVEPRQYEDLPFRGRGDSADARAGGGAGHRARGPLPPLLRAGQGAGGPPAIRRGFRPIRKGQRAETAGVPLQYRAEPPRYRSADCPLHPRAV
ncbi:tetratricopeptide repeat protein [Microbulbifer taiwanensis]|uniref:tetratricopeptide repeat protein n=1 Tax=Microbulbifer taiwanensis TaxID=986746 RepID=UPI00361B53E6